jgi:hypothetical protein
VGTWYWFKLSQQDGVLSGKIWADGQTEPTGWMFVQKNWAPLTGGVGVYGGAYTGFSASFDDFSAGPPPAAPSGNVATPRSTTTTTALAGVSTAANTGLKTQTGTPYPAGPSTLTSLARPSLGVLTAVAKPAQGIAGLAEGSKTKTS